MTEFPDSDGDGVPDAFEQRPTITEILQGTEPLIVELEGPRYPRKGEVYLAINEFKRAMVDYNLLDVEFQPYIVKRFISGRPFIRDN